MSVATSPDVSPGVNLQTTTSTLKQNHPIENVSPTTADVPTNNRDKPSSNSANSNRNPNITVNPNTDLKDKSNTNTDANTNANAMNINTNPNANTRVGSNRLQIPIFYRQKEPGNLYKNTKKRILIHISIHISFFWN